MTIGNPRAVFYRKVFSFVFVGSATSSMRKSIHKQTIKSTNNLDTYAAYAAIFTSSKSQCAIFNYFLFLKEIVSVCLLMTRLVERVRCLCTANTKENWTKNIFECEKVFVVLEIYTGREHTKQKSHRKRSIDGWMHRKYDVSLCLSSSSSSSEPNRKREKVRRKSTLNCPIRTNTLGSVDKSCVCEKAKKWIDIRWETKRRIFMEWFTVVQADKKLW